MDIMPRRNVSMSPLPRTTPEAQGIPSAAISAFIEAVERQVDAMHSFILVRHGVVVAEGWWTPYRPTDPHSLYSLSKSFTSTAVGLLIAEGRLSLDDLVLDFFPEDAPADPSDNLKAMRVRHLLSMSTGHTTEPFSVMDQFPDKTWVELFLLHPVEHAPGTHFLYNSHATYMLSAIVQKITGGRLLKYLKPRLLDPLGIRGAKWERSPQGIDTGGWGLSITTRDEIHALAKMGQTATE
ncbi:MAG: serine hydrolase [Anaerolinea sp.]|nr:serine hydrolase [Anaerolinea sp.]